MRKASAKYDKVTWKPSVIKRMYAAGKTVADIARALGYPPYTGQNRVRNFLKKAGVYKPAVK